MKLKLEDKLKIIERYEDEHLISVISKKFKVCTSVIERIERQYREHGIESFKIKGKNKKYSPEFKMEIVNRILNGEAKTSIAAELCVNFGMIHSWFKKYQELGYNGLVNQKKGRPPKVKPNKEQVKINTNYVTLDNKDKLIKEQQERIAQLEMENDLLKKLRALVQQRKKQQDEKK